MADLDLGSILSSLSPDDINNLQKIAGSVLGGQSKEQPIQSHESGAGERSDNAEAGGNPLSGLDLSALGLPDMSVISSLAPLLGAFNKHDERSDFIVALKPLLSEPRRKKADEAAKLIKLLSVLPLLKERGIM